MLWIISQICGSFPAVREIVIVLPACPYFGIVTLESEISNDHCRAGTYSQLFLGTTWAYVCTQAGVLREEVAVLAAKTSSAVVAFYAV